MCGTYYLNSTTKNDSSLILYEIISYSVAARVSWLHTVITIYCENRNQIFVPSTRINQWVLVRAKEWGPLGVLGAACWRRCCLWNAARTPSWGDPELSSGWWWLTTIWGASWWDSSLSSKTVSHQFWVTDTKGDKRGAVRRVFTAFEEIGCSVAWWPASWSVDSTAACSGGGRVVTAQNALPLTRSKTVILPRDSLRVRRRARCTYRFF